MIQSLLITWFHFINISDFQEIYSSSGIFYLNQCLQLRIMKLIPEHHVWYETLISLFVSFFFYLTWSQVRCFVTCQAGNLTREAPTESCLFLAASPVCIRSLFSAKLLTFCKLKTRIILYTSHSSNTQTNWACFSAGPHQAPQTFFVVVLVRN